LLGIDEVGGSVQASMDIFRLSNNAHDIETHKNIVSMIANFSLQMLVVEIFKVCAKHDNWNSTKDQLPPVLPLDLCPVLLRDFMYCLQQQGICFMQKLSEEDVEKLMTFFVSWVDSIQGANKQQR
jgi:hypothetical protein